MSDPQCPRRLFGWAEVITNEVSRNALNIALAVGTGGVTVVATAPPVAVGIAVLVLAACIGLAFVRAAGSSER